MYVSQTPVGVDRPAPSTGAREDRHPPRAGRLTCNDALVGGRRGESRDDGVVAADVAELLQEIDGLRRRLATQPTIEQAKGVLVGLYGINPDTAFAVLVRWSKHTNTKLHLLAADLVAAAAQCTDQRPATLHRLINQMPSSGPDSLATQATR